MTYSPKAHNGALFLCGGSGSRMAGQVDDKILAPLGGKPVFRHSLDAFRASGLVRALTIVYRDDAQKEALSTLLVEAKADELEVSWVVGGKERQDSVFNGLMALSLLIDYVFIHDCARPLVHPRALQAVFEAAVADQAAVLARPVTDTIKRVPRGNRNTRRRTLEDMPREQLWAMETPQVFARELITDAYRRLRYDNEVVTDDTAAVARLGHPVSLVHYPQPNPKLTRPEDLAYMEFLLRQRHATAAQKPL